MAKKQCIKCGRTKDESLGFYTYKNGQKAQMCKECMLAHVNIWQQDTYLWLLEKMDVPYAPWEWDNLRAKAYAKNPKKLNDTTVFGKYLSMMKLNQWKKYTWADTEKVQEQHRLEQEARKQRGQDLEQEQDKYQKQFENGQISQAQYRTLVKTDVQREHDYQKLQADAASRAAAAVGSGNLYNEKNFIAEEDIPDFSEDLSEQDKKYLAIKWGRLYTPNEWVQLQSFYNEMMDSFDIQDADSKSSLILICKNNLKMNQAIDTGDLEGYQKIARVNDTLRKSAKFTAAQNKEHKDDFVDSVGQLVAYCQKYGHQIPQFNIKTVNKDGIDVIDKILDNLKEYTKTLIYEDTALARQIEDYLNRRIAMEEKQKAEKEAKEKGLDHVEVTDQDLAAFEAEKEKQRQLDKKVQEVG